jgi:phage/plasmid-like protein (TIGR03299 family)
MPDNVTTMAYNSEKGPPWHGKGVPVRGLATAAECIRAAGLDWSVAKIPLRLDDTGGLPVPGVMATVRTDLPLRDPRRILGVVGEEYRPLQNWEAFRFFDEVVGVGAAIYETAGAIDHGRWIWLLARLEGVLRPAPEDEVHPYVLLANGHDGRLMVHLAFTPVRVVCQNTLILALEGAQRHFVFRHDRGLPRRLREAGALLRSLLETTRAAEAEWQQMAQRRLAAPEAWRYFDLVFRPGPDDENEEGLPAVEPVLRRAGRPQRLKEAAWEDYQSSLNDYLGVAETLWAAYNAAVWAVDWVHRSQRDRVEDLCLGDGARLKERALTLARRWLANGSGSTPPSGETSLHRPDAGGHPGALKRWSRYW